MKIGILCPSEIAFRRFLPSLKKCTGLFEYAGVAVAAGDEWFGGTPHEAVLKAEYEKAEKFREAYGGEVFKSYAALLSGDAECIYIPLPPALHYQWAKQALLQGKHVLLEKPFTTTRADTQELLDLAKAKSLAVHENYMFQYHSQIDFIKDEIANKTIGDLRLIRIDFGFPFRGTNDFRYNKALGGGALLDCGGYTLKLASILLGESARLVQSSLGHKEGFDVDIYGNAVMVNKDGLTAQIAFGMDNSYKCSLEVWGSGGTIHTNRILTAPDGFEPVIKIKTDDEREVKLSGDDCFKKSIGRFYACIESRENREENYKNILRQANLVEEFIHGVNKNH